jgi:hypothetical protein
MTKRLAVGIATVAIALSGFSAATAVAQAEPAPAAPPGPTTTEPAPPGTDVESMISHCTQQLGEDQRGPAAESMRQMMAENMTGAAMGSGAMGEG